MNAASVTNNGPTFLVNGWLTRRLSGESQLPLCWEAGFSRGRK